MAGKSSHSYIPLYDTTRPQPVEQASKEESLYYFPPVRIAEDGSFADRMGQKSYPTSTNQPETLQRQHCSKPLVRNDQNAPPSKPEPQRRSRMSSQVVSALENNKPYDGADYAGGKKKVEAICLSFSHKSTVLI